MAKEKNNEARQNIIRNAFYMFQDQGFDKVLMKDLAARCEIGQPLLQYYFNRKEDLLLQIFYDLHIKSTIFINNNLMPDIQHSSFDSQYLSVGVAYMLYFKTLACNKERLLDLFSELLNNTPLFRRCTELIVSYAVNSTHPHPDFDFTICSCVLNGCLQQFIALHKEADPMFSTVEKTVDLALDCYYGYSGMSLEERPRIIEEIHTIVSDARVRAFFDQYTASIHDGFVLIE